MAKITLAEALLRRKELQMKVDQLKPINVKDLYEVKFQRKTISDQIDEVIAQVPKVSINEITAAYDHYAKRLRQIDAVIQQANWNTQLDVEGSVMADYEPKA